MAIFVGQYCWCTQNAILSHCLLEEYKKKQWRKQAMSGKRNRIMADKGMTDFVKYSTYTYNIKNALWHNHSLKKICVYCMGRKFWFIFRYSTTDIYLNLFHSHHTFLLLLFFIDWLVYCICSCLPDCKNRDEITEF